MTHSTLTPDTTSPVAIAGAPTAAIATSAAAPTPAAGAALIESARMSVKKAPKRTTSDLSARNAGVSGKVLLVTRAVAPVATYALVNEEPRR